MDAVKKIGWEENTGRNKIHPVKFALYVGCASIIMMFAGFTSAYVVRRAGGNWLEFEIPSMFFTSTVVILLSSLVLHLSYIGFKKGKTLAYRGLLILATILGFAFILLQYQGWQELLAQGIELTTNPASSFIYIISGAHAAHVLGGIVTLFVALGYALSRKHYVNARRKLKFELVLIYWHFVDILWIYLLVFFLLQQ